MPSLIWPSAICLVSFIVIGAVDGTYFHLQRFRLYARPTSRTEHLTHTLRALAIIPAVWLLYAVKSSGLQLYAAVLVVAADVGIVVWDMLLERSSRVDLGGLPPAEYVVHVLATGLHGAALALAFASRPLSAWSLAAPPILEEGPPSGVRIIAYVVVAVAWVVFLVHVALMHPRFSRASPSEQP